MCVALLAACNTEAPKIVFKDIPFDQADAGSGEKIFQQSNNSAPACTTCHTTDGSVKIGPSFAGFAERAASRVNGLSAEEYAYWSIIRPAKYIVAGYSNLMYAEYEKHLTAADIADIIAYLLTFK